MVQEENGANHENSVHLYALGCDDDSLMTRRGLVEAHRTSAAG
jgi:hypothetical protein